MSEKKERFRRQLEAAKRKLMEEELERWRRATCWFPSLKREDIAKARPLFVEADVVLIDKATPPMRVLP